MTDDGYTISFLPCEPRCDLAEVSDRDLILGHCPVCSAAIPGEAAVRMLAARLRASEGHAVHTTLRCRPPT